MLRIFRVTGDSMRPLLHEGDFVLALTVLRRVKLNRLLVVRHPTFGIIIKRVISIAADGSFFLASDNAAGVSTRQMGVMKPEQVLGRVLWCVRQR